MQEPIIGLAATIKLKEEKKEGSEAKQKHRRTQHFFFFFKYLGAHFGGAYSSLSNFFFLKDDYLANTVKIRQCLFTCFDELKHPTVT